MINTQMAYRFMLPQMESKVNVLLNNCKQNKTSLSLLVGTTVGVCLLISSLLGKALRTHVDIARLAERFNMRSQSRAW